MVVDLECSAECQDITATGTNLTAPNGTATYVCKNIASTAEVRCLFVTADVARLDVSTGSVA